ncbi:geranylgeranyl reductase family protein [candidate division GN15 bacterium]|nr:geranylgeranyl reductase family protein [candidate division GN15 bacterium]
MNEYTQPRIDNRNLSSLPDKTYDVLIVGAGPAGSSCAAYLARHGHRVLLVDRKAFPRDKPCGDCLLPDAQRSLTDLKVLESVSRAGRILENATVYSPSGYSFDVPGTYITCPRERLDTILLDRAIRDGVSFAVADVDELKVEDDTTVAGHDRVTGETVRAPLAVVATGYHASLARASGLLQNSVPYAIARRRYVRSNYRLDRMVLMYGKRIAPGYMWIIPVGPELYNVGCGVINLPHLNTSRLLRRAERFIAEESEHGRELMAHGEPVSPVHGAALRCQLIGLPPVSRGRILAVGEIMGTTFPFTGEGIGKALESGRLAASVIDRAKRRANYRIVSDYSAMVDSQLRPQYRGYIRAQRWLTRPSINDFLAKRIQRSTYLQQEFARFMQQTGDPRRVFALGEIIKSYFK